MHEVTKKKRCNPRKNNGEIDQSSGSIPTTKETIPITKQAIPSIGVQTTQARGKKTLNLRPKRLAVQSSQNLFVAA